MVEHQEPVRIPVVCMAGRLVRIYPAFVLDPDDIGADEVVAVVLLVLLQPRGVELVEAPVGLYQLTRLDGALSQVLALAVAGVLEVLRPLALGLKRLLDHRLPFALRPVAVLPAPDEHLPLVVDSRMLAVIHIAVCRGPPGDRPLLDHPPRP